jgi:hypothetical protein
MIMIRKFRAIPRWLAAAAALVLAAGLSFGIASHANASGPYAAQGTTLNLCISLSNESHIYAELHSNALGNCAAGYEQITVTADPGRYPIPVGSTSGDVVTVTYPGAQTWTEGEAITPLDMSASSNQGHTISWAASSSPAGLIGAGELTINPATGVISGTPTGITGTYVVTVTATDSAGTTGTTTFDVTINP